LSQITNDNTPGLGTFDTTRPGSRYAMFSAAAGAPAALTFSFANPIDAFGFYVTGLGSDGTMSLTFNDGSPQTIAITGGTGGGFSDAQFFGVTDFGAAIASVSLNLGANYYVGIDDVSFSSPVPEPASIVLLGSGLALAIRRRRHRAK
jgi:hypothetical protein